MGKKGGRKQGKPVAMSLAEFQKETPSSMSVPRQEQIAPSAWEKVNLQTDQNQANKKTPKPSGDAVQPITQTQEQSRYQNSQDQEEVKHEEEYNDTLSAQIAEKPQKKTQSQAQKVVPQKSEEPKEDDEWNEVTTKIDKKEAKKQSAYQAPPKRAQNQQKQNQPQPQPKQALYSFHQPKPAAPAKPLVPVGMPMPAPKFNGVAFNPSMPMPQPAPFVSPFQQGMPQPQVQGMPPPPMAGGMPMFTPQPVFQPTMPGMPMPQQHPAQMQATDKPKPKPAPKNIDDVMRLVEQDGQKKLEAQKKKQEMQQRPQQKQQNNEYGDEQYQDYGNEYGEELEGPEPNMIPQGLDPNMITQMISQLQIQGDQAQFNPDQMAFMQNLANTGNMGSMFQPSQGNMDPNAQYNPDYIEYDDEADYGQESEVVILSNDPVPKEIGVVKSIGTRKGGSKSAIQEIPKEVLADIQDDDDAIIAHFIENNKSKVLCQYFITKNCKYGDKCQYLHPKEYDEYNKNLNGGQGGYNGFSAEDAAHNQEYDEECQVCLEMVLENGKQFGVLDGCDHVFCLKCIRGWRATYDKRTSKHHFRTCPICRKTSYLVIPSYYMVNSGPEKDELIEEYRETVKAIPCSHFNKGQGVCPFRNSCMYAHRLADGKDYEYPWENNKLIDGEWVEDVEETLADRIGMI